MAQWLTDPYAWFTFTLSLVFAWTIGYSTRGIIERRKRDGSK